MMLETKTAFITGAASGIGLETTKRFLQDSKYNPIFAVDKDPAINTLFPSLEYPSIVPVQIDLRDYEAARRLLRKVASESGRLDVVVNSAGVMSKGRTETFWSKDGTPTQELNDMEETNLGAPVVIMAEASGIMRDNGGGVIINVTSAKHLFPDMHHIEYQRGKMRLSRMTRNLARSFMENDRVKLVDIQPGNTKTNIDRDVWPNGTNEIEMATVRTINDWWRNRFGNDPKKVAEVIYSVAEGKTRGTTVYVGLDSQIGRLMFLLTYPLVAYRWDHLFFIGSTVFYQVATLGNILKGKLNRLRLNNK